MRLALALIACAAFSARGAAGVLRAAGPAPLQLLSVGVVVDDGPADTVELTLRGPADRWFAVGFGGAVMDGAYAVVVGLSPMGEVLTYEVSLGAHRVARQLAASATLAGAQRSGADVEVRLTRARVGATADYYTFRTTDGSLDVIQALGAPGAPVTPLTGHAQRAAEAVPFGAPYNALVPVPPAGYVPYDSRTFPTSDDDDWPGELIFAVVMGVALLVAVLGVVGRAVFFPRVRPADGGVPPPPPSEHDRGRGIGGPTYGQKQSSVATEDIDVQVTESPRAAATAASQIVVIEEGRSPGRSANGGSPVGVYGSPERVVPLPSRVHGFTQPYVDAHDRAVAAPPTPPAHSFFADAPTPKYTHDVPHNFGRFSPAPEGYDSSDTNETAPPPQRRTRSVSFAEELTPTASPAPVVQVHNHYYHVSASPPDAAAPLPAVQLMPPDPKALPAESPRPSPARSPRTASSTGCTVSSPSATPTPRAMSPRRSPAPAGDEFRRHVAVSGIMDDTRRVLDRVERNQRLIDARFV
eukprot:TRINITY_DN19230_c0_g1_i1.p1 TRINITY_DN19230_c0_g1~~TRINITY_DN19230_c0_g1_i1.p1  ORF type:complete len:525 (+),score=133.94 TRINITY_DN19230_c0_g1_i1:92-1666(+)